MSDNKSSSVPSSYTLAPVVVPIFATSRQDLQGKSYSDRAEGMAKLQRDIEDINQLSKKPNVSAKDIEQLKERTGLNTYNASQRLSLFKQAGLWGQVAYELNGMSFEYILEEISALTISEIEIICKVGATYAGVGESSQIVHILQFILAFERGQSSRNIDWTTGTISLKNRTVVEWNRMKFTRNDLIVLPNPSHREKLLSSSSTQPAYYGIPFPPGKTEEPQYPNDNRELGQLIWKELIKEGSCASINIWDGSIFTWGRGFAGYGGALIDLLSRLYQDTQIGELFRNVGIHITMDKKLMIMNTKGNSVLIGGGNSRDPWDYIKKNKSLLLFFISLCEMVYMPFVDSDSTKAEIRNKVINEQFNLIKDKSPVFNIPPAILANWRADLAGSDYKNFLSFIAHLFHWLPTFVGTDKTENNVLIRSDGTYIQGSIKELLFQFAKKAGKGRTKPWIDLLEVGKDPAVLFTVVHSLSTAKFGIERFILDGGHFKKWGNGIADEKVFKNAVVFKTLDEITNPKSASWLLSPKFNDAAVYFNPDLKSGYIITR